MRADSVEDYAAEIVKIQNKKLDFSAAVCGMTGSGKSTFAIQTGKAVSNLNKQKFSFEANVVYDRQSLFDAVSFQLPEKSVIVADEGINLLYKRESMTRGQIDLVKLFDVCRDRKMCVFFCIPQIHKLDKDIRDSHIKHWVQMYERGLAVVFGRDKNPAVKDPWHLMDNARRLYGWEHTPNVAKKSRNFRGMIRYAELGQDEEGEYLAVKHAKRISINDQDRILSLSAPEVKGKLYYLRLFYRDCKERLPEHAQGELLAWASELHEALLRKRRARII